MIYIGDRWADYRREGKIFIVTDKILTLGVDATNDLLIRVPDNSGIIALMQAEIADYADFYIYENPTLTNVGTALTPRNMNRAYSDGIDVLFFTNPQVNSVGTKIYDEFSLAWLGHFNEGTSVWEFKKGTDYLLRTHNLSEDPTYLKWRIVFRKITTDR